MLTLSLAEVALWTRGAVHGDAKIAIRGVATDTREPMPGALFVALKGDNFDAHDFLAQAKQGGAVAALVSHKADIDLPQVIVDDTLLALGDLASAVRAQRAAHVVGITGSNGKTTVKTLVASILALYGKTHVNAGNFNNEIGLPLSLFAMPIDAEYAVLEMGAGKPGDIAYLAAIARPEIGLVNNIAAAHLERMGSLEGIAQTKGALYESLPAHGVAIINADDAFATTFANMAAPRRVIRFGIDGATGRDGADVRAQIRKLGAQSQFTLHLPDVSGEIELPLAGRHNVSNALAAAAVAYALNVPLAIIQQGLQSAPAVKGRLARHAMPGGWTLIDDSYNANPASAAAAIAILAQEPGEAWLVLGDMRELGLQAKQLHAQTGELAKRSGVARLLAVGDLSRAAVDAFGGGAQHFADQAALTAALAGDVHAGVNVLVKGSRGSAMDRVVRALLAKSNGSEGGAQHAA